jgi:hypothetical protein
MASGEGGGTANFLAQIAFVKYLIYIVPFVFPHDLGFWDLVGNRIAMLLAAACLYGWLFRRLEMTEKWVG